jgi:hypothetical protein
MKVHTQTVRGMRDEIAFMGLKVPLGFLGTFRKEKHLDCHSGRGFLTIIQPGGAKTLSLCPCASERAKKKCKELGGEAFVELARKWAPEPRTE